MLTYFENLRLDSAELVVSTSTLAVGPARRLGFHFEYARPVEKSGRTRIGPPRTELDNRGDLAEFQPAAAWK